MYCFPFSHTLGSSLQLLRLERKAKLGLSMVCLWALSQSQWEHLLHEQFWVCHRKVALRPSVPPLTHNIPLEYVRPNDEEGGHMLTVGIYTFVCLMLLMAHLLFVFRVADGAERRRVATGNKQGGKFFHDLLAWREWLPIIYKHCFALMVDMFCVSLFSPGVLVGFLRVFSLKSYFVLRYT